MLLRRALFLGIVLGSLASAFGARADRAEMDKEECLSTYEQVQRERRAGHLVRASELTAKCLSPACPALLRADCESWRRELEEEVPSLIVEVEGVASSPIVLTIDERREPYPMRGPKAMDPGEHVVRVSAGDRSAEEKVTLASRQRAVRVVLRPTPPTRASESRAEAPAPRPGSEGGEGSSGLGPAFWAAGAVALTGLSVFAIAGIAGRDEHQELERTCGTRCSESDADGVSRTYLVADVGLVIGLLSTGVAVYLGLR